jgi:hypothetical protein
MTRDVPDTPLSDVLVEAALQCIVGDRCAQVVKRKRTLLNL